MTKKLLFLLATAGLILNVGGCTSKSSQDENQVIENADVDKIEAEELAAPPAEPGTEDASLQAALGETPQSANVADNSGLDLESTTETATTTTTDTTLNVAAPTLDESSLNDVPQPSIADSTAPTENLDSAVVSSNDSANLNAEPTPTIEASSTETTTETSSTRTVEASSQDMAAVSTPAKPSGGNLLKKIALTPPYQAAGGWVNAVYVARPGEKLKDISQTIYGSDKTKDLKKIAENSYLKSRSAKAADKIYYVSPNRPEDSSKTLFYFEDMGMVPETYVAKKGDNIKKVAKQILGYDQAWVEMWTSNPIESKTKLAEGDTLRYWRSASSINTETVAKNNPPQEVAPKLIDAAQAPASGLPDTASMQPPPDMNTLPPPPADAQLAANMPPPQDMNSLPPPPSGSELPHPPTADMNTLPPPPQPADLAPPPPPPPPMDAAEAAPVARKNVNHDNEESATTGGLDNDAMMSLGAVGVLTAALAFILIRRKKKKAAEQAAMSETNVGT